MMDEFDWETRELLEIRKHEELSQLHGRVASLMRERDLLRGENHVLRSRWDAAMRLLDELGSKLEDVENGDFPQFAQFASAAWVVDNLGSIRQMIAVWRADLEGPF